MPRIADYSVVRDSSFEIRTGGDIDRSFNFNLPNNAHLTSRSVLAFIMDTESNANNLRFQIAVNGNNVREARVNGDTFQTIHEVVNSNVLRHGSNTIDFRITNGAGDLHVSDVVLFWQRDI